MSSQSWYSCGLLFLLCLVDVSVLSNLVLLRFISSKASSRPQGKYMHHTHVNDDFLLLYILFARRNHEHEGTFPIFTSFALMHIAKIHVTHCLLYHAYAFTLPYSDDFNSGVAGQEDVEPLQDAKDKRLAKAQELKTLHFHCSDPRSH